MRVLVGLLLAVLLAFFVHRSSLCAEAVHHASDAMQAEEAAFSLTVGCSVGKVDDEWCTVKNVGALIDAAEAARRAFSASADYCR